MPYRWQHEAGGDAEPRATVADADVRVLSSRVFRHGHRGRNRCEYRAGTLTASPGRCYVIDTGSVQPSCIPTSESGQKGVGAGICRDVRPTGGHMGGRISDMYIGVRGYAITVGILSSGVISVV